MSGLDEQIQVVVATLIEEIVEDLDLDLDGPISASTRLIGEIGLASVDFIQLIVAIEEHFHRKMGFHDLLMPAGAYVSDLTVGELVAFIASKLQAGDTDLAPVAPTRISAPAPALADAVINPQIVSAFRAKLPVANRWARTSGPRNPRTLFVLTSPRSGSTLLRIILAGHPQLFAPPELHLLDYADLAQRKAALANELNDHLLTGTIRALMQLRSCSADEAGQMMSKYEEQGLSTRQFFGILHQQLGGRLLVDKSPIYCLHPAVLQRAEEEFDEPLYLHLVRHPSGMVRSFEDAKIDALMPFMRESGFSRRQLAELTWLVSHENAVNFLRTIPAERQTLVRFEDLVQQPERTGRLLCDFLGLPFLTEMLDPYLEKKRRMTDGLSVASQYSGDLKFHLHDRIESHAADRWKHYPSESALSETTCRLAASLGYAFPT
jgi:acyl carrier protein